MLRETFVSNKALHDRFELPLSSPDVAERLCAEESREVIRASVIAEAFSNSAMLEDLAGEIADNIYVLIGLARAHSITAEQLESALMEINTKNDQKTPETHEVVNRKIVRKGK